MIDEYVSIIWRIHSQRLFVSILKQVRNVFLFSFCSAWNSFVFRLKADQIRIPTRFALLTAAYFAHDVSIQMRSSTFCIRVFLSLPNRIKSITCSGLICGQMYRIGRVRMLESTCFLAH